jgi:hypothetical protein
MVMFLSGESLAANATDGGEPCPCDVKKVGLDAGKFHIYITQDTPYASWTLWPGENRLSPGKEPHGTFITTYVNPVAHQAIITQSGMGYGSLIVMENYDADKKLTGLMVMMKIKGYNPQAGDWYWFHYDPQGTVLAAGRIESCINCHRSKNDNDFVMTAPVKK